MSEHVSDYEAYYAGLSGAELEIALEQVLIAQHDILTVIDDASSELATTNLHRLAIFKILGIPQEWEVQP